MKIAAIRISRPNDPSYANALVFPFKGASPGDPYIVKDLTGLGPPQMTVTQTSAIEQDSDISNVKFANRQLVGTFVLNPSYLDNVDFDDLRTALYNMVGAAGMRPLNIDLMKIGDTDFLYSTKAGISNAVPNLFTKGQELQVTWDCVSPFFVGPAIDSGNPGGAWGTTFNVNNPGTAYNGFTMQVLFLEDSPTFGITPDSTIFQDDLNTGMAPIFQSNYGFLAGDLVTLSTTPGNRYLSLLRDGITYQLHASILLGSAWPMLAPGDNTLSFTMTAGVQVPSLQIIPRYLGV